MPGWSWEGQILTSAQHFCVFKWIHTTSALVPARNHFLKNNLIHNLDSGWDRRGWVNLQSFPQRCGLFAPIPSCQHHQTIPLTLLLVVISPQDRVWDGGGQAQPACRVCGNLRGRVQARVHGQVFSALLLHGKFPKKVLGPLCSLCPLSFTTLGLWAFLCRSGCTKLFIPFPFNILFLAKIAGLIKVLTT